MRQRAKEQITADLLIFWRARFAVLLDKLRAHPSSGDAWFWRMQCEILNYLLHRYAGDAKQPLPEPALDIPFARLVAAQKSEPISSPPVASRAWPKPPDGAAEGKLPRASVQLRAALHDIAQGNQDRHTDIHRHRELLAEEKLLRRQQNREAIEWMKAYQEMFGLDLDQEDENPPPPEQLTEDEIVDALADIINMDQPPEQKQTSMNPRSEDTSR
jgi:hypothetical protein